MSNPKSLALAALLTLATTLAGPTVAAASFIDPRTGLEWMDVIPTLGFDYSEMTVQLAPGGQFEGWRYATRSELIGFLEHELMVPFGDTSGPSISYSCDGSVGFVDDSVCDRIVSRSLHNIWGITDASDGDGAFVKGMYDDQDASDASLGLLAVGTYGGIVSPWYNYVKLTDNATFGMSKLPPQSCAYYPNNADENGCIVGSLLVRPVAEPATLGLFGLSLAGLGLTARRRRAG